MKIKIGHSFAAATVGLDYRLFAILYELAPFSDSDMVLPRFPFMRRGLASNKLQLSFYLFWLCKKKYLHNCTVSLYAM